MCSYNWSSKLQENNARKKHPCSTNMLCFQKGFSGLTSSTTWVRNCLFWTYNTDADGGGIKCRVHQNPKYKTWPKNPFSTLYISRSKKSADSIRFTKNMIQKPQAWSTCKLRRYHDIIAYRDANLETISISDRFGLNRNIDISRYIAISRCFF